MLTKLDDVKDVDCIILAVAHDEFKNLKLNELKKLYVTGSDDEKVLIDVKGLHSVEELKKSGMRYWRL